jgi:hypothetical protein
MHAFLRAILQPLEQVDETAGQRCYPYVISPDAAQRLAHAFARARHAQPDAPLVPELQVVLNRDWYAPYSDQTLQDPPGPTTGDGRVLRGGSFSSTAPYLRAAFRNRSFPVDRDGVVIGFRLVSSRFRP